MVFEKKWTDEQNAKILELHGRISNEKIAKMFNTNAPNISKRVSYLKKKNKLVKKKSKKKIKKDNSERVEVIKAKSHPEADDFTKEYKQEFEPINKISENDETSCEIKIEESSMQEYKEEKVNWGGSSNIILSILDARFTKSEVTPLSDWEKEQFSQSAEACLEQYANFLSKYSNLISLGIITTEILVTRILEFIQHKKKLESKKDDAPFKKPTDEIPVKKILSNEEEIALSKQRLIEAQKQN